MAYVVAVVLLLVDRRPLTAVLVGCCEQVVFHDVDMTKESFFDAVMRVSATPSDHWLAKQGVVAAAAGVAPAAAPLAPKAKAGVVEDVLIVTHREGIRSLSQYARQNIRSTPCMCLLHVICLSAQTHDHPV